VAKRRSEYGRDRVRGLVEAEYGAARIHVSRADTRSEGYTEYRSVEVEFILLRLSSRECEKSTTSSRWKFSWEWLILSTAQIASLLYFFGDTDISHKYISREGNVLESTASALSRRSELDR